MTTFVLVHGAWHTARIWDSVREQLHVLGHDSVAVDLPIDAVGAAAEEYVRCIAAACAEVKNPVLVGHTSGALVLPLVAEACELQRLVFVNPLLPKIGKSFAEQTYAEDYVQGTDAGRQYDREARSFWNDEAEFARLLAADCDEQSLAKIWAQLRPQARRSLHEVTPLKSWPDVASSAILYTGDRDLPVDWMRQCIRDRVGVEPVELPGSQLGFVADPALFATTLVAATADA